MTRRLILFGLLAAVVGGVPTGLGFVSNPERASFAYLFSYTYAFTIVIGSLFVLMIGHASDARWFVALRRSTEHVVGVMPLLAVLFLPVLASMKWLYPWMRITTLGAVDRELLSRKTQWLNEPFFVARAAVYFAIFISISELLRRWSLRQDRDAAAADGLRRRMVALGAGGLSFLSLVVTLTSVDWWMSLEPTWSSNVYGVYIFAGGFVAALGLLGVMLVVDKRRGALPAGVSVEHYHAVGRLQLAMIVFWTYIAWIQLFLQWVADLPSEVSWYVNRWRGGWEWVGVVLLVLHWGFPFFFLLQRDLKRRAAPFFAMSAWIVAIHMVDVYYLVLPAFEPRHFRVSVLDGCSLAAVVGALVAFGAFRARGHAAYPVQDPTLEECLRYEAT